MSILSRLRSDPKALLGATLVAVALLAAVSRGQVGAPARAASRHLEFSHQQVQADALTQSLNDLDKQGWEIFQIVPTWTVKNENDEAMLVPKSYVIFSRRPIDPK